MVESLCLHVIVTGSKPMECILFVVVVFFFFFFFFKGPTHILLNIIKANPNPVHIRALRVQPIPYVLLNIIKAKSSPIQIKFAFN